MSVMYNCGLLLDVVDGAGRATGGAGAVGLDFVVELDAAPEPPAFDEVEAVLLCAFFELVAFFAILSSIFRPSC